MLASLGNNDIQTAYSQCVLFNHDTIMHFYISFGVDIGVSICEEQDDSRKTIRPKEY